MRIVPGDATRRERLQLLMFRRRMQHERRQELLEHVSVFLKQEPEDLLGVMV